jgi:hypothetical protein
MSQEVVGYLKNIFAVIGLLSTCVWLIVSVAYCEWVLENKK